MIDPLGLVIIGVVLALLFDFGNGFNDAANSISTIVATRVLTMRQAVLLAAVCNFIAAFVFGVAVATTIGKGIIDPAVVTPILIISALVGAIIWTYATTFLGLPISVSHALIGGLIGAGISAVGLNVLQMASMTTIVIFIFVAPVVGLLGAIIFSIITLWIARKINPSVVNNYFKKLQLLSVSIYSLGHGTNDAQKTMGIISIMLFSAGLLGTTFYVPWWVVILSHTTIALGTLAGGWMVVKTMGVRLTNLKPINGFCAESSCAFTIIICTMLGIPVSTTHVMSGAITGVGLTKRTSAVRWKIVRKMIYAWLFTIPTSAIISFTVYKILIVVL